MNWSRNASQPRNCGGACSTGPDQPWRANPPLTSANAASCRRDNNVTPGPFETVNSKSPVLEKRTSASPISVVFADRYMTWPLLVCHPAVGSENSWRETVAQLVMQRTAIARRERSVVATALWAVIGLMIRRQLFEPVPTFLSLARAWVSGQSD